MAGTQDVWQISGEDRAKYDMQFLQLQPVNGFLSGTQTRDFFMQSNLPTPVLGQIWTLADLNSDGKMDKKEFSIAMHLIKKKLQGYELPNVLPQSLKVDPTPVIGSFAQPMAGGLPMSQPMAGGLPMSQPMGLGFPMTGPGMPMGPLVQPQASLGTATMTTGSLGYAPVMTSAAYGQRFPLGNMPPLPMTAAISMGGIMNRSTPHTSGSIWTMTPNAKQKHTQTFIANDRNKRGYLLGVETRAILLQSNLPQAALAQIWSLSDVDRDGKLTCDEFCIAMHLTDLARMGHALPATLPPELVPTQTVSAGVAAVSSVAPVKDAFGDLLSSAGMPLPAQIVPAALVVEEVLEEQVTYEDRRKENFDRGQAELDRRRNLLKEQQQRENNERMEKERLEAEKRERQRQEAEMKRQAELQRQMEKQREREMEIEEQRRKVMEQREAARRELDRQRQMEWERQRKEQLMMEKQRELEQLGIMKSQMVNLRNELETLEAKKADLLVKISQAQKGVTDFTSSIDSMRLTRNQTLGDIDVYEKRSTDLNQKTSALGDEKSVLDDQVQAAHLSHPHGSVIQSLQSKKANIYRLKKEVEQLETDTQVRLREIQHGNTELKNLKDKLVKLEQDRPQTQKQSQNGTQIKKIFNNVLQNQKPDKKLNFEVTAGFSSDSANDGLLDVGSSNPANSVTGFGPVNWDTAFSGTLSSGTQASSSSAWDSGGTTTVGNGNQQKMKYRALYDFSASREDEITLVVGMEVWVLPDSTPVPGMEDWYRGEREGKIGWFPKAYVERLDQPSADLFGSAFGSLVQSSTAQKLGTIQQDIFSSSFSQPSSISSFPATSPSVSTHPPHNGMLAKAISSWKSKEGTDLTFNKDDVIVVKKQEDAKWFGELNGKSGWFPKTHVKPIDDDASKSQPGTSSTVANQGKTSKPAPDSTTSNQGKIAGQGKTSKSRADSITTRKTHTHSIDSSPSRPPGENYVALYTYASDEPTDLHFNEGDIIYVTATSGDWWTGTIADQGKSGIFPANYVKKLDIQLTKVMVTDSSASFDSLLGDFSSVIAPSSSAKASTTLSDVFHDLSDRHGATAAALDELDSLSVALQGDGVFSSFESVLPQSSGESETKPTHPLSPSISFDGSEAHEVENCNEIKDISVQGNNNVATGPSKVSPLDLKATTAKGTLTLQNLAQAESLPRQQSSAPSSGSVEVELLMGFLGSSPTEKSKQQAVTGGPERDVFGWGGSSLSVTEDESRSEQDMKDGSLLQSATVGIVASLPSGGASLPSGGASLTSGGASLPSGGASLTSSGTLLPSVGASLPSGGASLPSGGGSLTSSGGSLTSVGASTDLNLDWGFGAFGTTSTQLPVLSGSLLDNFDSLAVGGTSPSRGNILDFMDGWGLGPTSSKESTKATLKSSMSLPDILSLEDDAIGGDLFEIEDTSTFARSQNLLFSGDQTTSAMQVDLKTRKPKLGAKRAPLPPLPSDPPPGKTFFGRAKKTVEQKSSKKPGEKPEIAKVIAPYTASGSGQLSLEVGNLINVKQKSPRGWWEGELQVRGQKKKIGWFPANYVKVLSSSSARSTPEPTALASLTGSQLSTLHNASTYNGAPGHSAAVVALYSYTAQNDDELTFQKDAVITVLSRENPDWWSGQLDGQTGMFPSNYVTDSTS